MPKTRNSPSLLSGQTYSIYVNNVPEVSLKNHHLLLWRGVEEFEIEEIIDSRMCEGNSSIWYTGRD